MEFIYVYVYIYVYISLVSTLYICLVDEKYVCVYILIGTTREEAMLIPDRASPRVVPLLPISQMLTSGDASVTSGGGGAQLLVPNLTGRAATPAR